MALIGATAFIGQAADHSEAPGTRADNAADIADLYAWHNNGKLNTVITFAGLQGPSANQTGTYDPNVRYILNIDNNNDLAADIKITAQFKNIGGRWWLEVLDMPGTEVSILSEVDNVTIVNGSKVYAGLRDDPFFFDFDGYLATLNTATVSFDNTRDSFAGTNVTAIAYKIDLSNILADSVQPIKVWATTERNN